MCLSTYWDGWWRRQKPMNKEKIAQLTQQLFAVSQQLEEEIPGRSFLPSGQQLGNLGEVLVAEAFGLNLCKAMTKGIDAHTADGRMVQIKTVTSRAAGVMLSKRRPSLNTYLIAVRINPEGTFDVIYNGLEIHAWLVRQSGKPFVSMRPLLKAAQAIPADEQLPRLD